MKSVSKILMSAIASLGLCALMLASTPMAAQASIAQSKVVLENPADNTPHIVLDAPGKTVFAFAQIGSTMFVGGNFTQVQDPKRTKFYPRQNFFVFNAPTGVVSTLTLSFDNTVETLVPSSDGKAIFIGGDFKHVNGVARPSIVKYDLVTRQIDPTFYATSTLSGIVDDAKLVNGRLIVAGTMPGALLSLSPTTGKNTGYINVGIAGVMNTGDVTKVLRLAVNPAGTRLVAVGNFATVGGHVRKWAFELSLGATAVLNAWHPARLDQPCSSATSLNIAQNVDFSPDGTYFVIVSTGGPSGVDGLCDAAARYETTNVSGIAKDTWINFTGGDSLYAVAVTGAAVYVGGHARWLDNPLGDNSKGPGAVDRPGIGAIDPVTGKANSWNPTKTRNHGVQKFYATSSGLWTGSDGQYFNNEYHAGIAFSPLPK